MYVPVFHERAVATSPDQRLCEQQQSSLHVFRTCACSSKLHLCTRLVWLLACAHPHPPQRAEALALAEAARRKAEEHARAVAAEQRRMEELRRRQVGPRDRVSVQCHPPPSQRAQSSCQ
jgi:hypothetical protein